MIDLLKKCDFVDTIITFFREKFNIFQKEIAESDHSLD